MKKKVVPKALAPNPKRESKKDEIEKKADALIRRLNEEAEEKREALLAAERRAAKNAETYRIARANRERRELQQKENGEFPHSQDE